MSNQTDELADVAWDDKTKPPKTMDRTHLEGVNTAMLVLTSLFFVAQLYIRISKRKPYELHAFFCYFSYICYVGMWVMYIEENKPLYRAEGVQRGEIPMYPEILHDAGMIYRWMTAGQLLFYTSLTSVKLSLLVLYHKLLERTPRKYTFMWWGIFAFVLLAYIGSAMTTIFVCNDHKAKYNQGICATPIEQARSRFSLWFAYSVDVATDLTVMFLPFRMTWNLQMPRTEKLGFYILFGSGWICILFATLRVVQVGVESGVPKTPDPKWLQMWTVIETSMAVIIGCAPPFAAIIKSRFGTPDVSYDSRGYIKQSKSEEIKMKSMGSGSTDPRENRGDISWNDAHLSAEVLTHDGGRITVTTTANDDDRSGDVPGGKPGMYRNRPAVRPSRREAT